MRRRPDTYRRGVATVVGAIIAVAAMIALAVIVTQALDERARLAEERLERAREDLAVIPVVNSTGVYAEIINRGYVDTVVKHILVVNRSSGQIIYHAVPRLHIEPGNATVFRLGDWSSGRLDIAVVTQRGSVFRWDPELTLDGVLDLPGEPVNPPAADASSSITVPPTATASNTTITLLSGMYDGGVIVYPEPLVSYTNLSMPDIDLRVSLDATGYLIYVNGVYITSGTTYSLDPVVIGAVELGDVNVTLVVYGTGLYLVFTSNGYLVEVSGRASATVIARISTSAIPGVYVPIATTPLSSSYANTTGNYTLDFRKVGSGYTGYTRGGESGLFHGNYVQVFSYSGFYSGYNIDAQATISINIGYARIVTVNYTVQFTAASEVSYLMTLISRYNAVLNMLYDIAPRTVSILFEYNGSMYVRSVADEQRTWSYTPVNATLNAVLNPVMPLLTRGVIEHVDGTWYPWVFIAYDTQVFQSYTLGVKLQSGASTVLVYLTPSLGVELGSVESLVEDLGGCWGSMTIEGYVRTYTGCPVEPGLYVVGWYDPGSLVYTVQPVGVS